MHAAQSFINPNFNCLEFRRQINLDVRSQLKIGEDLVRGDRLTRAPETASRAQV